MGQAFVSYLYKKSIRSKQIDIIRTYLCTRGRTKILLVSCGVERELSRRRRKLGICVHDKVFLLNYYTFAISKKLQILKSQII